MINLGDDELTLKKKQVFSPGPQSIRSDSASENQRATRVFATSAESASASKEGIDNSYHHEFKSAGCAEIADLAERQLGRESSLAEFSRKSCGLQTMTCDDCKYFTPDSIGDGAGIAGCALGVTWTQAYNGRSSLYCYAHRYCARFTLNMLVNNMKKNAGDSVIFNNFLSETKSISQMNITGSR